MGTWTEIAETIETLPEWFNEAREHRGVSLRMAARQMDVSFVALARFARRGNPHGVGNQPIICAVLRWLDRGDFDD